MSYYQSRSGAGSVGVGCLLLLVFAVVVFGLGLVIAPYYTTQIWWAIRAGLFVLLPLGIVAALGIGAVVTFDRNESAGAGLGLLAVVAFLGSIGFWVAHSYLQDSTYVGSVKVVDTPMPAMAYRAPFTVAQAQANPDLGAINGERKTTTYLPDRKEFTTLVGWRGPFRGYEDLLVQHVSETGRNTHDVCAFSLVADRQFGALFNHSLGRLVNTSERLVNWDDQDVYAYCDAQGHPQVVVPLKAQSGVFVVTERPAGVAVYHGDTGTMDVITDPARIARIPGPTYPLSIAARQRESTGALTGFANWWFDRAGYELPSDMQDINSSNTSEYVLGTANGGHPTYVTLLTGRGSATAIAAISTVDATQTGTGLAPVTIHRTNPVWLSPASIEDRIHANFGDVFMLQTRATISELAPLDGQHWVATIGLAQNMLYRVTGVGDLSTDSCLLKLTGEQIRCGPAALTGGAGPGVAVGQLPGTANTPGVVPAPASSDLHILSTPQLLDLINRANQELASRAGGR